MANNEGDLRGSRVAIVGLGYVGLPTALSFADRGAQVLGIDVSESRIDAIREHSADMLDRDRLRLSSALRDGRLSLTSDPSAMSSVDLIVICVPTPIDEHLSPDLSAISGACASVVEHAVVQQTIVLTSTTYPGCTYDLLVLPLQQRGMRIGEDVFVAFSPERIDPGNPAHSPESTPRVLGGYTLACSVRAAELMRHTASSLHVVSSPQAAEVTKLLENTFRAVNIALINEFADAARVLNVDIAEVVDAAATKPYGFMPFRPGPGVGGHCIPCDPHYLLWQLRARRRFLPVVEAAMTSLSGRPQKVVTRARQILADHGKSLCGARVLMIGVSYKPGLGDIRESPALEIIDSMVAEGAKVSFTDPYIDALTTTIAGELHSLANPADLQWDLIIMHTAHPSTDILFLENEQCPVLDATYNLRRAHVHQL